jgi:hypothetical protein
LPLARKLRELFPTLRLSSANERTQGAAAEWTHVLIVADPQILDLQSYPERSWILRHISKLMTDLNMRRSWAAARRLRPDAVIFLGDMMDRGRVDMPDKECVWSVLICP